MYYIIRYLQLFARLFSCVSRFYFWENFDFLQRACFNENNVIEFVYINIIYITPTIQVFESNFHHLDLKVITHNKLQNTILFG